MGKVVWENELYDRLEKLESGGRDLPTGAAVAYPVGVATLAAIVLLAIALF